MNTNAKRNRILVVKLGDIGDLLAITPALRLLRRANPTAKIDLLCPPGPAKVLAGLDSFDEIIPFDKHTFDSPRLALQPKSLAKALRLVWRLRKGGYDEHYLFHHLYTAWGSLKYVALSLAADASKRFGVGNSLWARLILNRRANDFGFGGRSEVDYWLDVARQSEPVGRLIDSGLASSGGLEIALAESDYEKPKELLKGLVSSEASDSKRPIVTLHPGSGAFSIARRYPAERFARLGRLLEERLGASVVVIGGPEEAELCQEVAKGLTRPLVLAGETNLKETAALIELADLFVGNDAGLMHLAVAVGTPLVAVFGPSNYRAWGPYGGTLFEDGKDDSQLSAEIGPKRLVVSRNLHCQPCFYRGRSMGNRFGCPARLCLNTISPDELFRACAEALEGSSSSGRFSLD